MKLPLDERSMSRKVTLGSSGQTIFQIASAPQDEQLSCQTLIVGQSGCGKTSLVARFLEEIVLSDVGSVIFLDYNLDFSRFAQPVTKWRDIRKLC
jgi:GTPase SAR1 family protein